MKETTMNVAIHGARFAMPRASEMSGSRSCVPGSGDHEEGGRDEPVANIWKMAPEKPRTAPRP